MTSMFKRESDGRTVTVAKVDDEHGPGFTLTFPDKSGEGTYQVRAGFATSAERDASYDQLTRDVVFDLVDATLNTGLEDE